jgi:hypothetical protein
MVMAKSAKPTAIPLFTIVATLTVIATWAMVVVVHGVK